MKEQVFINKKNYLEGQILIASPHLEDIYFQHALIYICSHDENGAVGIIINQQIGTITSEELFKIFSKSRHLQDKKIIKAKKNFPLLFGGPINTDMLFALSITKQQEIAFAKERNINVHIDVGEFMENLHQGKIKPSKFILAKGVSAWEANQLEEEIRENSWLMAPPSIDLLFSQKIKNKWKIVIQQLGINNFNNLVSYSGNS